MIEETIPVGASHYRARYYDSNVGRFLSEDPIGFRAGINFYRYVKNKTQKLAGQPFTFLIRTDDVWQRPA